jgi:hypothetical protein
MGRRIVLLVAFVAVVLVLVNTAPAQDPVEVNPGKYTVVFENDRVRLLEYRDKPGDASVLHEHPAHLVYSLSEWEREFILPDGTSRKANAKAGDAFWAPAGRHSAKNIGSTSTHALIFELKDGSLQGDTEETQEP